MKHFDTFTGYGGFTISAQKLGWETIGFSEIDKYANAVLEYNFNIKNYGDITKIKGEDLPGVDIITGGSPCQDLSVAGKGAGLDGARSGLFFHFIRLIKEKQPTYFIWENVKGAFSSQRGWDFARVQIEMEQAGYDVFWQLINAKDFGVPQNRERIFAIGIRKGSGREILFEQRESVKNLEFIGGTRHRKKWLGDGKEHSRNFSQGDRIYSPEGTSQNLNANGGGLGAKTGLYCVGIIPESIKEKGNYLPRERVFDAKGNARAVSTVGSQHPMYAVAARNRGEGKQAEFNNSGNVNSITSVQTDSMVAIDLSTQEPRTTENVRAIQARYHKGYSKRKGEVSGVLDGMRIRRLTPLECERLMGLEDGWTAKGIIDGEEVDISDTQRYRMCGNGVVVNCVDYIYKLIN